MFRSCQEWKPTVLMLLTVFVLTLLFLPIAHPVYASDPLQTAATVELQYFTISVQYPAVVLPGANLIVSAQTVAKSAAYINSLTSYVYYSDGESLHQLTSTTLLSGQNVRH